MQRLLRLPNLTVDLALRKFIDQDETPVGLSELFNINTVMDGKPSQFYDDIITQVARMKGLTRNSQPVKTVAWQVVKTKLPAALQPSVRLVGQNKEYPAVVDWITIDSLYTDYTKAQANATTSGRVSNILDVTEEIQNRAEQSDKVETVLNRVEGILNNLSQPSTSNYRGSGNYRGRGGYRGNRGGKNFYNSKSEQSSPQQAENSQRESKGGYRGRGSSNRGTRGGLKRGFFAH